MGVRNPPELGTRRSGARAIQVVAPARGPPDCEDGALMAVYASSAQLVSYLLDNQDVGAPTGDEAERLLQRAERDVDLVVGPWPILSTSRKFDPPTLPVTAREALARATCAAAEYRLTLGPQHFVGEEDYLPSGLTLVGRPPGRVAPKVIEELAGHGLILTSLTVGPDLIA